MLRISSHGGGKLWNNSTPRRCWPIFIKPIQNFAAAAARKIDLLFEVLRWRRNNLPKTNTHSRVCVLGAFSCTRAKQIFSHEAINGEKYWAERAKRIHIYINQNSAHGNGSASEPGGEKGCALCNKINTWMMCIKYSSEAPRLRTRFARPWKKIPSCVCICVCTHGKQHKILKVTCLACNPSASPLWIKRLPFYSANSHPSGLGGCEKRSDAPGQLFAPFSRPIENADPEWMTTGLTRYKRWPAARVPDWILNGRSLFFLSG